MRWYQTLAWSFFLRQAAAILGLLAIVLWVAYREAGRAARTAAGASLGAAGYALDRALEQQGRSLDAGLEVFSQYSANLALVERALEAGAVPSLEDALQENLPRLGAETAVILRPDGRLLAAAEKDTRTALPEAGILQMALAPEEARAAGHPGPAYRGFLRVDWGPRPGIYHAVARPLRSPGGKQLGAMLVGVRLDGRAAADLRRLAIAGPQKGDPPAQLALLSRFQSLGATLAGTDALDRLLARETAFLEVRGRVLDGQRSTVLPFDLDGVAYLGMLSPLRGVNALDLEMAEFLMMPVDPLLAPFRTVQRAILAVGGAGLLVALALGLRSARKVTAPLKALAAAAEALAEGDPPPEVRSGAPATDEVGVLTRTFNSMLAELRAKDGMLALLEGEARGAAEAGGPEFTRRIVAPAAPGSGGGEPLRPGDLFASRYLVEGVLGRGGMGEVLKVRDTLLDEVVALKVLRGGLSGDPEYLEMLKREIRLARRITHRYVLRTHDFGESGGIPFVTMEFLKGVSLRKLLDGRGRLPGPLVLRIARQVAEGLEAAHAVGVVHRDIKPANVMFDARGDARIMDFGLAAPLAGGGGDGPIVGTPRYMAPEQIRGEAVDARTDLYALGVMVFELAAGFPPFEGPDIKDLLALHLERPAPSLAESAPGTAPDLAALTARLLEKRAQDRPQSATEVAEVLRIVAAQGGASSRMP